MLPWLRDHVGNPHSHTHAAGRASSEAIEAARAEIASLLGASPNEIVFTSGATEATNLALRGAIAKKRGHIVTTAIEHSCVRETVADLKRQGVPASVIGVGADGLVESAEIAEAITDRTRIVSVMLVNNETGVEQPLDEIATICRAAEVLLHSDAAQALGKLAIDTSRLGVDFLSLSSHKVYGPPGIGALFCRARARAELRPLFTGGGQERGLRPGTLPTALCVGFGAACAILTREGATEREQIRGHRDYLLGVLAARVDGMHVNGTLQHRVAGNLNVAFEGIDADVLLARLPELALSTGSACASAAIEPSHVLVAMGLPRALVMGSVRICIGRQTTRSEIEFAAARIAEEVQRLRQRRAPSAQRSAAIRGRRA
jgi:cysteine desulfurase